MTGVSHSIVTFATLYVATHNVFIAGSAMLGSLFPDKSEGLFWQSAHRSCSHWFVLYVAALAFFWTPDVLSVTGVQMWQAGLIPMMRRFLFWFAAGGLFHILEDAICGSHQTDDGAAPLVQSGLGGGVPFCYSVLRGSVSDCGKTVGGFRRFPVLTGGGAHVTALRTLTQSVTKSAGQRADELFSVSFIIRCKMIRRNDIIGMGYGEE